MSKEYEREVCEQIRLADVLDRLARTQLNLDVPLTVGERADLRAAARQLRRCR